MVELPAGLVDGDEPVEATALRELAGCLMNPDQCFVCSTLITTFVGLDGFRLYEETGYGKGDDGGVASVQDVEKFMVVSLQSKAHLLIFASWGLTIRKNLSLTTFFL